jgi:hypothetical protein
MENACQLQRKTLRVREKSRWRKNNGKQWKNNAENSAENNETSDM